MVFLFSDKYNEDTSMLMATNHLQQEDEEKNFSELEEADQNTHILMADVRGGFPGGLHPLYTTLRMES